MANLAQMAAKLQAKDSERSVLVDDIKACEALRSEGRCQLIDDSKLVVITFTVI